MITIFNLNILQGLILQCLPPINNSENQPENRNLKALASIRLENQNRPIIGQLNTNYV